MSVKRELATCTELETDVVTPTGTTYALSNGDAAFVRIYSTTAFKCRGNASDGTGALYPANTVHRFPCYHQTIYLEQATTAGFGALNITWEL